MTETINKINLKLPLIKVYHQHLSQTYLLLIWSFHENLLKAWWIMNKILTHIKNNWLEIKLL